MTERPYLSSLPGGAHPATPMAEPGAELGPRDGSRAPYGLEPLMVEKPTANSATVSLVFGILAICFTPPLVSALVAIIYGLLARREIQRSGGRLGGGRQALTGLALGAVALALSLIGLVIYALIWIISLSVQTGSL